ARHELEKQSESLKRKSGEKADLKKDGAATSKGLTGELGQVVVVGGKAPRSQTADRLVDELSTVDIRPDAVLKVLQGKSKTELDLISKLYEERTDEKSQKVRGKGWDGRTRT